MKRAPLLVGALLSLLLVACEKPGAGLPAGKSTTTFKAQVATIDLTDDLWDGHAISYGGFRAGQRPGGVYPTDAEILEDLRILETNWNLIRVYNSDEHGDAVLRMIAKNDLDLKVMLGIYIYQTKNLAEEALAANEALNQHYINEGLRLAAAYPDLVVGINVGNEVLVSWSFVPNEVNTIRRYVQQVAAGLEASGLKIPLTVADNYAFWESAAAVPLAGDLDFIVVHGYGILDGAGIADGLTFLSDHIAAVKANLPGKPVIVGETGWATYAEDAQIQSTIGTGANEVNAEIYFDQIRKWTETTGITTMLFEAFDEPWKGEGNDGAAEGHWGVFDANRRPKLAMHRYYRELVTTEPTSPSYEGFEFVPAVKVGLAFREMTVAELGLETTAQNLFSCTLQESPVAFAGTQSLMFSHDGKGRGGFFSNFDPALDLGDRTNVVFALSGVPEQTAYFELRFEGGGEGKSVNILSYKPVVAGDWHVYSLPLRDFTGVDFAQVKIMGFWHPFSNAVYAENLGHYIAADILIDDLHFE